MWVTPPPPSTFTLFAGGSQVTEETAEEETELLPLRFFVLVAAVGPARSCGPVGDPFSEVGPRYPLSLLPQGYLARALQGKGVPCPQKLNRPPSVAGGRDSQCSVLGVMGLVTVAGGGGVLVGGVVMEDFLVRELRVRGECRMVMGGMVV